MENNGTRVKVRIYGQDYTIAGDRDEETIKAIAACVDEKMREVGRNYASNAQGSLAVLAAYSAASQNISNSLRFFIARSTVFRISSQSVLLASSYTPSTRNPASLAVFMA